jgi:uridine phosphorylase
MRASQAQQALGLAAHEVPHLLVLEGTWWHADALARRLPQLRDARSLRHPDLWLGWSGGAPVAYCAAYGAERAVEPLHLLALCGTPVAVQIGSCGGLQPHVRTGDLVVSTRATIGEGASQHYGGRGASAADAALVRRAAELATAAGVPVHVGPTVTTSALLAQPDALVRGWSRAGHLGVDMETSAVLSAAARLGVRAASVLFVWDELPHRSWTDPFTPAERAAQTRASALVLQVAMGLRESPLTPRPATPRPPRDGSAAPGGPGAAGA